MLPIPTPDLIESKQITEGATYEFKVQIDLDDARQKSNLVDDVVAFLNSGPGHIVVGVQERAGAFERYRPLTGNPELVTRRLLSILQDNIEPRPLRVDVRAMPVEGGFLLDIDVAEHLLRPHQNRLNGAFYLRTGAKNTPLSRAEVASLFVGLEAYEHDVARRLAEEEARLAARNLMQAGGPSLHVGIVPREFYERGRAMFSPGGNRPKSISLFHDRRGAVFRGCDGGYEATEIDFHEKVISRTFVGHDWFVHAHVAHAFTADASGRVRLHEFKSDLTTFLADLDEFLTEEGLRGPFCVVLAVRNLRRSEKVAWVFPAAEAVELPRGALVERVAAPTLIDTFHGQLLGASRYG